MDVINEPALQILVVLLFAAVVAQVADSTLHARQRRRERALRTTKPPLGP